MTPSELIDVLLLGVIEGLTEFLPVSSTGHLILADAVLGFTGPGGSSFKIAIQLGAIAAVLVAYRRRFAEVAVGLVRRSPDAWAFTRNIALAVLPAMAVGVVAYSAIKALLETPAVVAWALIGGGIVILAVERLVPAPTVHAIPAMGWRRALGVGAFQCLAMVPGVSRSGATIIGALTLGMERRVAAEFSFFLAVPTMIAAVTYDLYRSWDDLSADAPAAIALGFAVAFGVALAVVRAFVALVGRHGFAPFAWYRIAVGTAALALLP